MGADCSVIILRRTEDNHTGVWQITVKFNQTYLCPGYSRHHEHCELVPELEKKILPRVHNPPPPVFLWKLCIFDVP